MPLILWMLFWNQVQLIVDRDLIYAIGGMENGGYTSTVEVYDPVQQIWSEVDSMSQARCNPGKFLYLIVSISNTKHTFFLLPSFAKKYTNHLSFDISILHILTCSCLASSILNFIWILNHWLGRNRAGYGVLWRYILKVSFSVIWISTDRNQNFRLEADTGLEIARMHQMHSTIYVDRW